MPQEHYIMTIQSIWNKEPRTPATASGLIETDGLSAEAVYEAVKAKAIDHWQDTYGVPGRGTFGGRDLGDVAVLFYQRQVNEE